MMGRLAEVRCALSRTCSPEAEGSRRSEGGERESNRHCPGEDDSDSHQRAGRGEVERDIKRDCLTKGLARNR